MGENNNGKFKAMTVTSYKKTLPKQEHRSSGDFDLSELGKNYLLWKCPEGISFSLKQNKRMWTDPVLCQKITNGTITKCIDKDNVYIADPKGVNEDYFLIEINSIERPVNWLDALIDLDEKNININLPGTHDSASIAFDAGWYSPYSRQRKSILEQLLAGIRILDIRLKVKEESGNIYFQTCHGNIGWNEYRPFKNILNDCKTFLAHYKTEFIMIVA